VRLVTSFNADWVFSDRFDPEMVGVLQSGKAIVLPHSAVELPLTYFDEGLYQKAFLYQKILVWREEFSDQEVSLVFDGAMADAEVYINGKSVATHKDGYTPFEVRLSEHLSTGDNLISVKIDGTENPAIPPFGGQIDFLTYSGIYRDVWLKICDPVSIDSVRVETADVLETKKRLTVTAAFLNPQELEFSGRMTVELFDPENRPIRRTEAIVSQGGAILGLDELERIKLWEPDRPTMYRIKVSLKTDKGRDVCNTFFGFRAAEFTADGFMLNGKPFKLRGLNRHQSFPYVGYAMGRRAQERDAEILKQDLKCNVVRTSHYPQSPFFLDHCDRIGLLVIEEIPGWQHIGDKDWKKASVENTRAMIERDWNHPSIIMWGVRINESGDDHEFYAETNRLAKRLDPTRPTGGVRCIENSEFLEDVYTMNDFYLGLPPSARGNKPPMPLREQKSVTGLPTNVPYLVTEYNGHMYPTKRIDGEERQSEHVLRHLRVLDAAYGDPHISGAIGWCMFDYNTHRDFGSGDKICHHGVMDMFREPKFAAYVYKSQCPPSDEPVLKPVTYWARGERSVGGILPLIVLTNCDFIEFRFGQNKPKRIYPDRETFPNLPYAPVVIDARSVAPSEAGEWGMAWEDGYFTGFVDGEPVRKLRLPSNPIPTKLELVADTDYLAAQPKDSTRMIVRALDQFGNVLPYFDDVVSLEVTGPARVVGPDVIVLKSGLAGFWIETEGGAGEIAATAFSQRLGVARAMIEAIKPRTKYARMVPQATVRADS